MTVYLRFSITEPTDLGLVDEGLALIEDSAVQWVQCLTEDATPGQCKDAAKRLVAIADLRHRIRQAKNEYEAGLAEEARLREADASGNASPSDDEEAV